jgi:hypothetical protein
MSIWWRWRGIEGRVGRGGKERERRMWGGLGHDRENERHRDDKNDRNH